MEYSNNQCEHVYVITVCRNARYLLEQTMLSVLHQTYCYVHYIIIDGASQDGTIEVIRKYENYLDFWISEPDSGIYDAMNKGLQFIDKLIKNNSSSVWVNFMNAGDGFVDENVLFDIFGKNGLLNASHSHECALVLGGNTKDVFPNNVTRIHNAEHPVFLPQRITHSHQSTFVKYNPTSKMLRWRFNTRYMYAADYDLLLGIYRKYGEKAFVIVDRVIASYRHEGSTTSMNQKKVFVEYLRIQSDWTSLLWWKSVVKYVAKLF